ncbi:DEAD/DEAH box helicase family protein [Kitasatospora sp. NBC_00315]|uniref:DEAD/DEAH box helicase family protein n=1 Tax=Kitasatospora sp. NBC_00315 TaxID=2975963 RepID=UPI00352C522D
MLAGGGAGEREAGGRVHAQVTTQAARIAGLVASEKEGEPVTVYATYASLERIVKAHKECGLPAWDAVIIDEAHRTAGSEGKAWAAIHSDDKVPALRRLYFSATPKIVDDSKAKPGLADRTAGGDGQELPALCSMTDTRTTARASSPGPSDRASSTATSPTTACWCTSSPTKSCANSSASPPLPTCGPRGRTGNCCAWPCRSRCFAPSRTWSCAGARPGSPVLAGVRQSLVTGQRRCLSGRPPAPRSAAVLPLARRRPAGSGPVAGG